MITDLLDLAVDLERTASRLDRAYAAHRARLQATINRGEDGRLPTDLPEDVTDANGRPVLLDALAALGQVQAARAQLAVAITGTVPFPGGA